MKKSASKASVKTGGTATPKTQSATGSTASLTSGHLGSLTTDQSSALAELWLHLLALFSQPPDTHVVSTKLPKPSRSGSASSLPSPVVESPSPVQITDEPPVSSVSSASTVPATAAPAPFTAGSGPATVGAIRNEMWLATQDMHPDAFLLRFLRARKFDVAKAYAMYITALKWRVESGVQDVITRGEAAIARDQFESTKCYYYGCDQLGRPVIYINARFHNKSAQDEAMLQRHTVYMMELGRLLLDGTETVAIVFNLGGFGMSNMDSGMVQFLIGCLEAYYPESLGVCLIVNAPWIFSGVWKMIKPWLDPVVQAKIAFPKTSDLTQVLDAEHIPRDVSGESDSKGYAFKYPIPTDEEIAAHVIDPVKSAALLAERMVAADAAEADAREWATLWLAEHRPASLAALAGGSAPAHAAASGSNSALGGVSAARTLMDARRGKWVETQGRPTWWKYDDYHRFTTMYHRMGVISRSGGPADWTKAWSN
ncbi:CRAL-TRIO domain-containing protein [Blastocladiella britannica]|nr:CRAL-TRIO domain-containing protein [Blastocladiella britannica]